jgi:hypothetical protein
LTVVFPVSAQIGGAGSIAGVVADPTGALIPGATVEATDAATGVKSTRQTTAAGYFVLAALPAGDYTVRVTAPGFETIIQQHVIVDALATTSFNPTMSIGAATEQVTITAAPPEIDTSDASIGQTVRNEVFTALPLTMGIGGASVNSPRDPTSFVQFMPGVSGYGGNTAGTVMGGTTRSEEVYIDGLSATTAGAQGEVRYLALGITIEAVDQFQLQSAGASVQYSGQGSTNFVIKSGTNQFHGLAYENIRNSDLDSRGFFPALRPINKQNEFGGTFGGPIRRNKLFFFGSYGGYRTIQSTTPTVISLPTLLERTGNFSELPTQIYDPLTTSCVSGSCSRTAFPGNIIPSSRIASPSNFFQSFLPAPTNSALVSNYLGTEPVGFGVNNTTEKMDYNISDKHRIYGFFSRGKRADTTLYRNGNIPLPYTDSRLVSEIMSNGQMKETWLISNALLNEASIGFSRYWIPIADGTMVSNCGAGGGGEAAGVGKYCNNWMAAGGISGLPAGEAAGSFPYMTFSGPNSPFSWRNGNSPAFNDAENNLTMEDNLQYTHGKHSVTVGGMIQRLQTNYKAQTYGTFAQWTFANTETAGYGATGTMLSSSGNSYASYLLGALDSANVTDDSVVETGGRLRNYSWWVEDKIKITPHVTLNVGLRHDIRMPWVEVANRMSYLNPALPNPAIGGYAGGLEFEGYGQDSCQCRDNISTYLKNFQPRAGLAWGINDRTVVRAGFGVTSFRYGVTGGTGTYQGTGALGLVANPNFATLDSGATPAFYWQSGFPAYQKAPFFSPSYGSGFYTGTPNGLAMTYGDPSMVPPRYLTWNVGIQRELIPTMTLNLTYVGSVGHHLPKGTLGFWSDQMAPQYLALKNLLNASATSANLASAQATIPGVSLPYANYSGTISQMLRPFPQFASVNDVYGAIGNSNYQSLQAVLQKNFSHGVTGNFNYTFSKEWDDLAGFSSWVDDKALSTNPLHVFNALITYRVPLGRGQALLSHSNRVVSAIVSFWQLSGITTYRSGAGLGAIGASCTLPNAGSCWASYNPSFSGNVRINGGYGNGNLSGANTTAYIDVTAFASPAAYTFGNTPRDLAYGLRGPGFFNQNLSLRRQFTLTERVRLSFQADSLNAFNSVSFSNPGTTITTATFGRITSQANTPRDLQFGARLTF